MKNTGGQSDVAIETGSRVMYFEQWKKIPQAREFKELTDWGENGFSPQSLEGTSPVVTLTLDGFRFMNFRTARGQFILFNPVSIC